MERKDATDPSTTGGHAAYTPPALVVIGPVSEFTFGSAGTKGDGGVSKRTA